jgi:hypothetical protein
MPRLVVFLSSLIIVVALTFIFPNTAKAAEPSKTKATIEARVQELIPEIVFQNSLGWVFAPKSR